MIPGYHDISSKMKEDEERWYEQEFGDTREEDERGIRHLIGAPGGPGREETDVPGR